MSRSDTNLPSPLAGEGEPTAEPVAGERQGCRTGILLGHAINMSVNKYTAEQITPLS